MGTACLILVGGFVRLASFSVSFVLESDLTRPEECHYLHLLNPDDSKSSNFLLLQTCKVGL